MYHLKPIRQALTSLTIGVSIPGVNVAGVLAHAGIPHSLCLWLGSGDSLLKRSPRRIKIRNYLKEMYQSTLPKGKGALSNQKALSSYTL
jgi:hypothetical protein